jgi:DNA-binding HxlR family transcriptional regulator
LRIREINAKYLSANLKEKDNLGYVEVVREEKFGFKVKTEVTEDRV